MFTCMNLDQSSWSFQRGRRIGLLLKYRVRNDDDERSMQGGRPSVLRSQISRGWEENIPRKGSERGSVVHVHFFRCLSSGALGTDDYHSVRMDGMTGHHRKAMRNPDATKTLRLNRPLSAES
ncbi:hypothetical protein HNY73_016770 [Argiope bruennichi]|uniref:Uncharacterized protein n=1 Tax=Argiope bruennichi TaxID=94029 RepID=A0A8T0EL18_ARGBR|nr:hypothetical protein HNY73_016770 [Argiope bruennichi]